MECSWLFGFPGKVCWQKKHRQSRQNVVNTMEYVLNLKKEMAILAFYQLDCVRPWRKRVESSTGRSSWRHRRVQVSVVLADVPWQQTVKNYVFFFFMSVQMQKQDILYEFCILLRVIYGSIMLEGHKVDFTKVFCLMGDTDGHIWLLNYYVKEETSHICKHVSTCLQKFFVLICDFEFTPNLKVSYLAAADWLWSSLLRVVGEGGTPSSGSSHQCMAEVKFLQKHNS